jgi:transposase-like protein
MRKDDARRLDHATLEAMRERAVRSVQDGESPEVVAGVLGINRSTIYGWLAQYRRGGWGALKAKPLFGRPPKLHRSTTRRASFRPASSAARFCTSSAALGPRLRQGFQASARNLIDERRIVITWSPSC